MQKFFYNQDFRVINKILFKNEKNKAYFLKEMFKLKCNIEEL
jgi:hypothetical protein